MATPTPRPSSPPRPAGIHLPGIDVRDVDVAAAAAKARALLTDATYVTIGLGVLGLQRFQVKRRELERALRR